MEIKLLDERTFNMSDISFDVETYTWTINSTGEDVTLNIRNSDKRLWSNFDADKYNLLVYSEHYKSLHNGTPPPAAGNDSTLGNFASQLYNDPFKAPIDAGLNILNNAGKAIVGGAFKNPLAIALIAGVAFLFIKTRK